MIRLKGKYKGKSALNIMGGPSILENKFDLSAIDKDKYVIFLESKSLTPRFVEYGLAPDYFLMFFPEKCQSNSLQHMMYQSLLVDFDLSPLLKPEHLDEYAAYKKDFDKFFDPWSPHKNIPFKRFRWKKTVKLPDSPFSLLEKFPGMPIITRKGSLEPYGDFVNCSMHDNYVYDYAPEKGDFSLENYYTPNEADNTTVLSCYNHMSSAAIALFPLQAYMGFENIYFIGMDMSMLGSMEYSSLYTFKSMAHYGKFFKKAMPVFNANFQKNSMAFMRPPYEFKSLKQILAYKKINFFNIFEPFKYALPVRFIKNITFQEFLHGYNPGKKIIFFWG